MAKELIWWKDFLKVSGEVEVEEWFKNQTV